MLQSVVGVVLLKLPIPLYKLQSPQRKTNASKKASHCHGRIMQFRPHLAMWYFCVAKEVKGDSLIDLRLNQALVVKSTSPGSRPPSAAFSQVQLPAVRFPQAHVDPVDSEFSVLARSQVHSPAGRAPVRLC